MKNDTQGINIISLKDSLKALKERFNSEGSERVQI
jgi:hypothetical protein